MRKEGEMMDGGGVEGRGKVESCHSIFTSPTCSRKTSGVPLLTFSIASLSPLFVSHSFRIKVWQ